MPPRFSFNTDLNIKCECTQLESILCLLEIESLQFEPNCEIFDFIKILEQIINIFSKFWNLKKKKHLCQNGKGTTIIR